ncbi:MAG: sigma-70 family RNA polymerase sigma factor [Planctomycetes bacterium]|nr:sigma-70 family RNA polymerase sigma factor [Planctomycetota bacterium]
MPINEAIDAQAMTNPDLLALSEALDELDALNQRHRQVVEMRFFGGLTIQETAEVLRVSPQTVKSDWAMARAWLRARLDD